MLRKLLIGLLVAVLVVSFISCGKEEATSGSESGEAKKLLPENMAKLQSVLEEGEFTYGLEAQYKPFEFRDEEGDIVGYDIDLASEIGKRLGVEAKPVDTSWGVVLQNLYNGDFDLIIGGMTATEQRFERVNFSVPYMDASSGLLVKTDGGIETVQDLEGKVVAGGEGTPSIGQLEIVRDEMGVSFDGEIKGFDDDSSAYEAMRTDRVDAYASSMVSLNNFAKEHEDFKVIPFKSEYWPREYSTIAFRKEDKGLRAIVNGILIEMKEDGTLYELQEKWFGRTYEDLPNTPPTW